MNDGKVTVSGNPNDGSDIFKIDIPRQELGVFLQSLLGQPRKIEKISNRQFKINHQFLINLDNIIDQRVTTQQKAHLTAFTATVHFDDHRSQTETSREAFRAFVDISTALTSGIDIVWTYLVWFPGREIPEKQEIAISISSSEADRREREIGSNSIRRLRRSIIWPEEPTSRIRVIIHYTEVTWGIDVLNYIENELRKAFAPDNTLVATLRVWLSAFSTFCIIPALMLPMLFYVWSVSANMNKAKQAALIELKKNSIYEQRVERSLDLLLSDFSGKFLDLMRALPSAVLRYISF